MILVDKALQERAASDRPVRVALIGAGKMGRGIARQIANATPGMEVAAIANRHLDGARRAYDEAGQPDARAVETPRDLQAAIACGVPAITSDPDLLCRADGIDAILEATGSIDYAAAIVCAAIENGKHAVLMNAELDGTVGPILKKKADAAGVVYTNVDGDQPGVTMNLYRFVTGIGIRPVLCGNIKGLQDPSRNPTTQVEFARKWDQTPHMVASFADGTKISFEQAIIANATGMGVARRGMIGPEVAPGTPIDEAAKLFPQDLLLEGDGIVDYVIGAAPAPGVFVLGTIADPVQCHYLDLYKMGEGPIYCFYTPYHLCHFEVPATIARAVLFGDATIAPAGPPRVEVVATAKIDLEAGRVLDEIGHYTTYGECENAEIVRREGLLPIGLAADCRVTRPLKRGEVIRQRDVEMPNERPIDRLRAEQEAAFGGS